MKKLIFLLAVVIIGCAKTPSVKDAYLKIVENANKNNWEYVYDNMDRYTQGVVNTSLKIMSEMVSSFKGEELKIKKYSSGRERFIDMCKKQDMLGENFKKNNPLVEKIDIKGKKAYLTVKEKNKEKEVIEMYFEDSRWKIHIEE